MLGALTIAKRVVESSDKVVPKNIQCFMVIEIPIFQFILILLYYHYFSCYYCYSYYFYRCFIVIINILFVIADSLI